EVAPPVPREVEPEDHHDDRARIHERGDEAAVHAAIIGPAPPAAQPGKPAFGVGGNPYPDPGAAGPVPGQRMQAWPDATSRAFAAGSPRFSVSILGRSRVELATPRSADPEGVDAEPRPAGRRDLDPDPEQRAPGRLRDRERQPDPALRE